MAYLQLHANSQAYNIVVHSSTQGILKDFFLPESMDMKSHRVKDRTIKKSNLS